MKKICFIDRDGTMVKEPHDEQVDRIDKIELVEGVIPAMLSLKATGYRFVMVTNQDGLGTESFPTQDFEIPQNYILKLFTSQGLTFDDILVCPHFPSDNCSCRKPHLGLVREYLDSSKYDLSKSFVVGDRESDYLLAKNMGVLGYQLSEDLNWQDIVNDVLSLKREASLTRNTNETEITIDLCLEGNGNIEINTGSKFYDHMLEQVTKHSGVDAKILCNGDWSVDDHHSIEDVAIALGECYSKALGDRFGITRFEFALPMDDSQARCLVDLGGRPYYLGEFSFDREKVGDLSTEMIPHFFKSFSQGLKANIHMSCKGENEHHKVEALFKSLGKALGRAIAVTNNQLPSTKGLL